MQRLNIGKSVKKISIVGPRGSGIIILHKGKKSKRKKQSKELKPFGKIVRKMSKDNLKSAKSFDKNNKKSDRKKKDGWMKDLSKNMSKANKNKSMKKFKMM